MGRKILLITLTLTIIFSVMVISNAAAATSSTPMIHLKFDGDVTDSSGNGYDGEKTGTIEYVDGVLGKAANFQNAFLELKNTEQLNFKGNTATVSVWVKYNATTEGSNIFRKPEVSDDRTSVLEAVLGYAGTGIGTESRYGDAAHYYTCHVGSLDKKIMQEKWTLITWVFNGKQVKGYVDGKFVKSDTIADYALGTSTDFFTSTKRMLVGNDAGNPLNAQLDDLRVYNNAFSDDEIKAMYDEVDAGKGTIVLTIDKPFMLVNKVQKEIDPGRGTSPIVVNGRTLVPIRSVIEAMGGTVGWDGKEQRVDITLKGKVIKLWIDKLDAQVDGATKTMDVPPAVMKERTMIPLRFVTENLGAQIVWDPASQQITIKY